MPKDKSKKTRNQFIVFETEIPDFTRVREVSKLEHVSLPRSTCVYITKTQMTNIIRNKETVREAYEKGLRESKMRNRTSQYADFNDAAWEWLKKYLARANSRCGKVRLR